MGLYGFSDPQTTRNIGRTDKLATAGNSVVVHSGLNKQRRVATSAQDDFTVRLRARQILLTQPGGEPLLHALASSMPSLRALNSTTCKHDTWVLRALYPEVVKYSYVDKRQGEVHAERFQCILVGEDCKLYCYGAVPWDPKQPAKAKQALSKFKHSSLWKVKCPVLDKKAKSEYMGCPMKIQIILDSPSDLTLIVGIASVTVAEHIDPPLKLAQLPDQINKLTFDFVVKIAQSSAPRQEVVRGELSSIGESWVVDETNSKALVSLWGKNAAAFHGQEGKIALVFNAKVKDKKDRMGITVPSNAKIEFVSPEKHASLARVDVTLDSKMEAHGVWKPESKPISVEGDATVMPAGLLSMLSDFTKPEDRDSTVLQVNSAYFELDTDVILNREADRLWMTGKLRDASGSCSVSLTSAAVCDLFQVSGKEQALEMRTHGKLVSS